ncbi:asparagine synthase-related protein [Magnetococcales bacterium HHB-1]
MMSAIFGTVHWLRDTIEQSSLQKMALALKHWSPKPAKTVQEKFIGLGKLPFNFTPEDVQDHQPLHSASRKFHLIAHARLDNREELLRYFNIAQKNWHTTPDSQLILKAYITWGEACPEKLDGDFAFALWNSREKMLFCARDRLGSHPFYYHNTQDQFTFASQPAAIFAHGLIEPQLNDTRFADLLLLIHKDAEQSYYKNIFQLPPAHTMTVTQAGVQKKEYWAFDPHKELEPRSDHDYLEAFRELFFKSVSSRLRTQKNHGIFLSGGLDSSAVACVAARLLREQGKTLHAFCSVPLPEFKAQLPPPRVADELSYVQAIAQQENNLIIHSIDCSGETFLDPLEHTFQTMERPPRNPNNHLWMDTILKVAQSYDIGVLFTGQRGNASISWGGLGLLSELMLKGHWIQLIQEISALKKVEEKSLIHLIKQELIKPIIPRSIWEFYLKQRVSGMPPWFRNSTISPDFFQKMIMKERIKALGENMTYQPAPNQHQNRWELMDSASADLGDFFTLMSAPYHNQTLDPTGDYRLMEFCLSLPARFSMHQGERRLLVREGLKGILPEKIRLRTSRGLQAADAPLRTLQIRPQLQTILDRFEQKRSIHSRLDISLMRRYLEQQHPDHITQHIGNNLALLRGITMGLFIEWVEKQSF